jgi:hypothetical protein
VKQSANHHMSTSTPGSSVDSAKALDRLTRKSGAPRAHGFMLSAEDDLDLDPDRVRMVQVTVEGGPARIVRRKRARGILGRLGLRQTTAE